ncbi:hypothetical protein U4N76_26375 [Klebsiella pneumoniae]|uniref:hypothetical protein n=1 Tax=Enterobacterales TaxID=91347 RepID=UPI001BD06AA1|nr:hypothetical protein [Citrobacter freundii]MDZ6354746.1 hypothetical protein [Klebsiella pneumoniae]MDZ6360773.1 hypothetical protein [Klebsiella pneumoniae]HBM8996690.1 hypothetical protein [Citrobacter freundii]
MKKISGLALVSLMLVGCAASQPPAMPVDSNPSDALKFARAMDLRQITDAGDQYLIYNGFLSNGQIVPLKSPVKAGENGVANSGGNGLADVAAGFATHTSFIPVLSVLTARRAAAISDGIVRVASWNGKSQEDNEREVNTILWNTLTRMDGYKVGGVCEGKGGAVEILVRRKATNGDWLSYVDIAPTLPKPPINVSGHATFILGNECFNLYATRVSNVKLVKAMSKELGAQRALFLPGSPEHEPMVFSDGKQYLFRK